MWSRECRGDSKIINFHVATQIPLGNRVFVLLAEHRPLFDLPSQGCFGRRAIPVADVPSSALGGGRGGAEGLDDLPRG